MPCLGRAIVRVCRMGLSSSPERMGATGRPVKAVPVRWTPAVMVDELDTRPTLDRKQRLATRSSDRGAYQGGYDADAEFKRAVPKPPGYLPDDMEVVHHPRALLRDRGESVTAASRYNDTANGGDLTRWEASVGMSHQQDSVDGDRGDVLFARS